MKGWLNRFPYFVFGVLVLSSTFSFAQSSSMQICTTTSAAPACQAVRGDRSEGWLQQTRSEVMARNGIVTTVQPLAAQAGLRILQQGGNAIDAAVATAAALNVVYPANTGIGGDLFAIIYVAKEKKVYQLNASGIAPSGLTLAHMNSLGYKVNPANFGPGSGMPSGGILTVTVPGSLWGWQEVLDAVRHEDIQGGLAAGHRLRRARISGDRGNRKRLAHEECSAARGVLHAGGSGLREDLLRQRNPPGGRHDLQEP